MSYSCVALLDAAAEALVLVDAASPATIDTLANIFGEFGNCAPDQSVAEAGRAAEACARAFARGQSDLGELGACYARLDAAVRLGTAAIEADRPMPPPASHPERTGGRRPAPKPVASVVAMPLANDEELVRDFVVRATEYCDAADEQLLLLEADPSNREAIDAVFRAFHTIKGMAGFLDLTAVGEHAHASEDLLAGARADGGSIDAETIATLFSAVDRMRLLVRTPHPEGGLGAADNSPAVAAPAALIPQKAGAAHDTVRVDESRLDALLDTIGELVIAESMASAAARANDDATIVEALLVRLDKITRELQHMATAMRMVPVRATFRRMARLVRDLSVKSGKQVELVLEGEDTELDKAVVDAIYDPLVHALRNAVDHGIEGTEERVAAGKPACGRVTLRAFHSGGAIHLEVSDDGRGIDVADVEKVARERGLLGEEEAADDRALLALVCTPGFSTATQITDVSGRGVGMDVVKRAIEALRGRLELSSERGVGTTLAIRLPITLAVIDGMVARVGAERFIIPMLSIERSTRPTADQIATVAGAGEMLVTDGGLVPIVRLHRLLGVDGAEVDPTAGVVIITSEGGTRAGLLACELLGQQQTVIKPVGDALPDQPGIAGAAIMPDGKVGLILDAAGLVGAAHTEGE